jgi:hypothetical protein
VAKACYASRRTLYRMSGDEGVAARLRRMRIEHAQAILVAEPGLPVASVGFVCGFDSDGTRQVVRGQDNLCLIRSGQDWSDSRIGPGGGPAFRDLIECPNDH